MPVLNPGGGGTSTVPVAFGTAGARPAAAAGNSGTAYFATDTGEVTFSNGAAWSGIAQITPNLKLGGTMTMVTNGAGGAIFLNNGNSALTTSSIDVRANNGSFDVLTIGQGLKVAEGTNGKQGVSTLVAGSVVVANTSVTATSRILLTSNADGGTPGFLRVSARSVGTSFTITSSSGTDTSTVAWQIFEPG